SYREQYGESGAFRLIDPDEMNDPDSGPKEGLFSRTDDFLALTEAARKNPQIHELPLKGAEHYRELALEFRKNREVVPLFLKSPEGELSIIPGEHMAPKEVKEGSQLVYMGRE